MLQIIGKVTLNLFQQLNIKQLNQKPLLWKDIIVGLGIIWQDLSVEESVIVKQNI